MASARKAASDGNVSGPVTKEALHKRLATAKTAKQLDAIEDDARSVGYSDDGVLLTALREKRDAL